MDPVHESETEAEVEVASEVAAEAEVTDEADAVAEIEEEESGEEEIITPAWTTEPHHLEAHALRKQAVLTGRPTGLAWSSGPNHSWVFDRPAPVQPEYDDVGEVTPYNFIADPHVALEAMAEYHRFQDHMHRQLGTAC